MSDQEEDLEIIKSIDLDENHSELILNVESSDQIRSNLETITKEKLLNYIIQYEKKLKAIEFEEINKEKQRRNSYAKYTSNMYMKLLEAENDHESEMEKANKQITDLKNELRLEKLKNNKNDNNSSDYGSDDDRNKRQITEKQHRYV